LVAHFLLRPGNTACVSGAQDFLGDMVARLPAHVRVVFVRTDSGFCTQCMIEELERRGLSYIMTTALWAPVRTLCRHDDSAWTPTNVPGLAVQEVAYGGARLIVVRQRITARHHAVGKTSLKLAVATE